MITVQREGEEILSIVIADEPLDSDDGETWVLPKGLLKGLAVNDLPADASFQVCKYVEDSTMFIDSIPMKITCTGDSQLAVLF